MIDFFKAIYKFDSRSKKKEGVEKIMSHLEQEFYRCGMSSLAFPEGHPDYGQLRVFSNQASSGPCVLLICHADTVLRGRSKDLRIEGNWLVAPGIADNKAALYMCLEFAKRWGKDGGLKLKIIISPSEERGSPGYSDVFKRLGTKADIILGLEPSVDEGAIISKRRGNRWYKFVTYGKSGHSGRFGDNSQNAIHEMTHLSSWLLRYREKHPEIALNINAISSQLDSYNVICDKAISKVDLRFFKNSDRDIFHRELLNFLECSQFDCPVFYSIEDDCPAMSASGLPLQYNEIVRNLLSTLMTKEGTSSKFDSNPSNLLRHSLGAADINYFYCEESLLLDGLGPISRNIHRMDESINIKSLSVRIDAINEMLDSLRRRRCELGENLERTI